MLWTEKYRPTKIEELDCPSFLKTFLESSIQNGFPHLLLYGPPGTGKTTFASLLSPTLQLNASDERGIDVIRNKIKKMANTTTQQTILLDECENLTRDSQTCLRRILEDFPNTRFIFCTNYYSKIIDPLKSRLLKIKFVLREGKALERIGKMEGIEAEDEFYRRIFEKCGRDLRKSVNILQGLHPLIYNININGNSNINGGLNDTINSDINALIDEFVGIISDKIICQFKNISLSTYPDFIRNFLFEGYSVLQLIDQLSSLDFTKDNLKKASMAKILSEVEGKAMSGCSEEVLLEYLCVNYLSIIN